MPRFFRKRLMLIPFTSILILILNFILVNFSKETQVTTLNEELSQYLKKVGPDSLEDDFSRSYGLGLPILFNTWPSMSLKKISKMLKNRDSKILKRAPYIINQLEALYLKENLLAEKELLYKLILKGKLEALISKHAFANEEMNFQITHEIAQIESKILKDFSNEIEDILPEQKLTLRKRLKIFFCETRFCCYFKKIAFLDFGTLRYNEAQKVLPYVIKRLKVSLTLLILPLILTFILAQLFGLLMALKENKLLGSILSLSFAVFYAIPLYIMVPLLIEKIGLRYNLPIHGVNFKCLSNLILPTIALLYGALAIYSRIYKTLFYRLFSQEYLFVAKAKGISKFRLLFVHTFREAFLTTIPLTLGSIGFFMSGLVIVENLLEIEGFGSAYYRAILSHDYNVIVFSTLLISMMTMLSYFLADVILYKLDPRISRNVDQRVFEKA